MRAWSRRRRVLTVGGGLAVLWLGQLLAKKFDWSMLKAILVLAIPVNYAWDFFVEGIAAKMGWWTYDPGMGPVLRFANGGQITLLWTIGLMCFWPNLIAYWAGKPPVRGLNHFERFFRLERFTRPKPTPAHTAPGHAALSEHQTATATLAPAAARHSKQQEYDDLLNYEVTIPRWKFELARFGSWFLVFQVSFFVMLVAPLVLMRIVTGNDSMYVP